MRAVCVFPNSSWPHLGSTQLTRVVSEFVCVWLYMCVWLCMSARTCVSVSVSAGEVALGEAALQLTLTSRLALQTFQSRHCPWNRINTTGCLPPTFHVSWIASRFKPVFHSAVSHMCCHCLTPQIHRNLSYSSEVSWAFSQLLPDAIAYVDSVCVWVCVCVYKSV